MKQVYRLDSDGFYIEPVVIEPHETLPDCIEVRPPDGLYKAQFIEGEWIEGMSQDEIEAIKNTPVEPSEIDILKKQQADLIFELMMNGVI